MGSILGSVAGAVVGGLGSKGNKGSSQTTTNEPWAPIQPILQDLANEGKDLNQFYQQNPFNAIQQQGYQNQLGDLDFFRNTLAPQLLGFANGQMNANYQRAPAGSELGGFLKPADSSQYLPPGQRPAQSSSGGLLGAIGSAQGMSPASAGMGTAGLMGQAAQQLNQGSDGVYSTKPMQQSQQAYFSAPQGQSYGQIDWAAMNPFTQINANKPSTEAPQETWEQIVDRERRRREAGMGWQPGYGDM